MSQEKKTRLRTLMLEHFQKVRLISSFKEKHPEFSDKEVNEMRKALIDAGDIEPVWGLTRATRYRITEAGKRKLAD